MTDPKIAGDFRLDAIGPHVEGISVVAKYASSDRVDALRQHAVRLHLAEAERLDELRKKRGDKFVERLGATYMTEEGIKTATDLCKEVFGLLIYEVKAPVDDNMQGDINNIDIQGRLWIASRLLDMQSLRRSSFPIGQVIGRPETESPPGDPPEPDAGRPEDFRLSGTEG